MPETMDTQLIADAKKGDKQAFGCLIERYEPMAYHLALRLVGNEDIARELTQEAFLQAYLSLKDLQFEGRFKNWLYGIVRNVCMSYVRKKDTTIDSKNGRIDELLSSLSSSTLTALEIIEADELHHCVLKAVNALPLPKKNVVLLFYYEGLSLEGVATILDVTPKAVKTRLFRARKDLGALLLQRYPEMVPTHVVPTRRKNMVAVKIADVIPAPKDGYYTVMLLDEIGRRVLPMVVSTTEGLALTVKNQTPSPRPTPTDFMANMLAATGVHLDEVRIESLRQHAISKQNILYAVAKVRNGQKESEVEARACEAIAVAQRMDSTILVNDDILDREGYRIPENSDSYEQMLQALVRLVFEFEGRQVTERVLRIIQVARQEAHRLRHNYVGSEHLLLALIREEDGIGVDVLHNLGMVSEETRSTIEERVHQGNKAAKVTKKISSTELIPFVPRTQQVLDFAMQEAQTTGAEVIGSGHVLLGLAKAESGVASKLLHEFGFRYELIRDEFNRISKC